MSPIELSWTAKKSIDKKFALDSWNLTLAMNFSCYLATSAEAEAVG